MDLKLGDFKPLETVAAWLHDSDRRIQFLSGLRMHKGALQNLQASRLVVKLSDTD